MCIPFLSEVLSGVSPSWLRLDVARSYIGAPLLDEYSHVGGEWGFESHLSFQHRMIEAEGLGMEGLTRAEGETVFDKLGVLAEAVAS